jgi:short-subunit dehydrogenase
VATVDTAEEASAAALAAELRDEEVSFLVNNAGQAGPVAPLTDIEVSPSRASS